MMVDREKVIGHLYDCLVASRLENMWVFVRKDIVGDALAMLKEQDDEKKRIMKVIWDTLHEGLSIDTVADQDWVYERIRHRIEDT